MKQGKNLVIILLVGVLFTSCSQKHNLSAEIDGLGNDTILVEYGPISKFSEMEEPIQDTVYSKNNMFIFDSPVKEPILVFMFSKKSGFKRMDGSPFYPMDKYLVLLIKPDDKIKVKGKLEEYYLEYEAEGSEFNKEYSQLREKYIKKTSKASKIELQIDTLMFNKGNKELISKLFSERKDINAIASSEQLNYIKSNWDKELSAYYLTRQRLDTLGKYYENLNADIREGIFKNMLENQCREFKKYTKVRDAEENIVVAKTAPNFSLKSASGLDFTLSSIKDRYVILDFWGSWCGWCIKGFPKMKDCYGKYKNKIEIIGIACNDTEEKWKKSIEENKLDWIHVINNKDIDSDVSVMYGIQGYPTKFILDKNKKILAKFVGESDDFYKKLDEVIKN